MQRRMRASSSEVRKARKWMERSRTQPRMVLICGREGDEKEEGDEEGRGAGEQIFSHLAACRVRPRHEACHY